MSLLFIVIILLPLVQDSVVICYSLEEIFLQLILNHQEIFSVSNHLH